MAGTDSGKMSSLVIRSLAMCLCLMVAGCAQQADVVKMNRDLNKKIAKLDNSKTELQQAVREANEALEEANLIIAQQREEIRTLLQARADLDDQMMTLKEGELSEVRGAIDENKHQMELLNQDIQGLHQQMEQTQGEFLKRDENIQPIVEKNQVSITQQREVVTTQAEKITEFRASMLDFQRALAAIREHIAQQDRQLQLAKNELERISQQQLAGNQSTTENFDEVKRSINSVVSAFEEVSQKLATRLDAQDQKLLQVSSRLANRTVSSSIATNHNQSAQTNNEVIRLPQQLRQDISHLALNVEPPVENRRAPMAAETAPQAAIPVTPDSISRKPSPLVQTPPSGEPVASLQPEPNREEVLREYQQQYAMLRAGNVNGARDGFRQFIQRYPQSSLAGNAQYWVGECFYAQRNFPQAILEFERVYKEYPSSNKVPAALLKIGYSNLELQQLARARSIFRQLVRTYPKSPEAAKAYTRLTEVERRSNIAPPSGPVS